ncbi:MAG TPA: hypothetical protein PKH23_01275 [Bacillota bacterium]|nr:hypothetical protein [Bacillota bacterium]
MKRGKAMKSIGVMVSALLFGFAVMGCRPKVVPMRYDLEYDVTAEPANECEIRPGLYCAVADPNEEGLFNLIEPHGDSAYLIRSQSFDTGAWVEVKEGEQLLILRAKLFTEEERRAQLAVSKPTPRNGFFMVGADLAEGHHLVRGLDSGEEGKPSCKVYADAHSLQGNPVRSYETSAGSFTDIDVANGEFLLLENAEIYLCQT